MKVSSLTTRKRSGVVCAVGQLMLCWQCVLGFEIHQHFPGGASLGGPWILGGGVVPYDG